MEVRNMAEMKTLTIGGTTYEVVDAQAREDTEALSERIRVAEEKIDDIETGESQVGTTPVFEVDEVVTLDAGERATVDIDNADPANPRISFGIPKGADGENGKDGNPGADGKDGSNGKDGADGVGIKSIAKTSASGLVDTYTITLTNNATATFTVTNGKDGTDGEDGSDGANGKSAYAYAQDGGYGGSETEFVNDLATIPEKVDKSYIVSVFEDLKLALADADIDGAIAVLDQAILDMATLA
jgi:hypothetical protein